MMKIFIHDYSLEDLPFTFRILHIHGRCEPFLQGFHSTYSCESQPRYFLNNETVILLNFDGRPSSDLGKEGCYNAGNKSHSSESFLLTKDVNEIYMQMRRH